MDHGKAFWKPKITPTNRDVGSVSGPAVENYRLEEEEDQGDHEMEAAREDTKKVKMMPTIPYSASWEVNS